MVCTINNRSTGTDSANFKIIISELQIILTYSTVFFFLLNNHVSLNHPRPHDPCLKPIICYRTRKPVNFNLSIDRDKQTRDLLGYDLDFRATVHLPSVFTAPDAMPGATGGCYPQGTREYQTLDSWCKYTTVGIWILKRCGVRYGGRKERQLPNGTIYRASQRVSRNPTTLTTFLGGFRAKTRSVRCSQALLKMERKGKTRREKKEKENKRKERNR